MTWTRAQKNAGQPRLDRLSEPEYSGAIRVDATVWSLP